ncbi:MAG TPA: polymer-forming cytoskeletal protein [Longimicrobium sp.]|nr:polymer-forming cytoskeletal protein [Longimicrobium sp.]
MRTDNIKLGVLALAVFAGSARLMAQDSLVLGTEPPAAVAAPAAPPAPRGPVPPVAPRVTVRDDVLQINGDRTIAAGETVDGDVVVLNGDLTVLGEVRGDVTVARGDLRLESGAVVTGDAVVSGGRLVDHGARVAGEMRVVDNGHAIGMRDGAPVATRVRLGRSWFAPIGQGLVGLMETLALGLVLAGVGAALIFYGLPHLNRLSDIVRNDTGRAVAIGLAANFLVIPAFIVGLVALAVTIVGIPLLLVYVPLFWVAVAGAAMVGVVAVAHALGERTAEQRGSFEVRHRNAYAYVFTGLALLLAPLLAAHLLGMTGFLGFVGDLVGFFAGVMLWLAASVGVGAVLITGSRVWRERRYRRIMGLGGLDDASPGGAGAV